MARQWAYFDASALAKRYVQEEGSAKVRMLLKRYRVVSAAIVTVELVSALSRRRLEGDLAPADFSAIVSRLLKDRGHWHLLEVSAHVLTRAEEVVQASPLRTLDAIHVAGALVFEGASGLRSPFVTGDFRQSIAATSLGLDVVEVG